MDSLDTSAVKLGALSDCMQLPHRSLHGYRAQPRQIWRSDQLSNYHKDFRVVVLWRAYFKMVILNQFIGIPTLDFLQVKSYVTTFVTYLLVREALTHVLTNATTKARPGTAFLYSRQNRSNSFVAHCIMSTKQNFMLVQLRHYNHARKFLQKALLSRILHTKDPISVDEYEIFFACDSYVRTRTRLRGKPND